MGQHASPDPYWVKITMSELDGLYDEQIQEGGITNQNERLTTMVDPE